MQAGVICWRLGENGPEVLLVKTSSGRQIFPKGHVHGAESGTQAALRELAEEAGMTCRLERAASFRTEWKGELLFVFQGQDARTLSRAFEPGRDPCWLSLPDARVALAVGRTSADADVLLAALDATRPNEVPFEGRWCPREECRGLLSYRRAHRAGQFQTFISCWACGWRQQIHEEADLASSAGGETATG